MPMEKPEEQSKEVQLVQKFLYCHPFYHWFEENGETMQLLVIGDSGITALFVDLSLQTGQMLEKSLEIIWCIGDERTRKEYLEARPALKEFVSVDTDNAAAEAYAKIRFEDIDRAVEAFGEHCRYVFAATSDCGTNKELAELFKQAGREDCLAAYLTDDEIEVSFSGKEDAPEFTERQSANRRISSMEELERMAFNTHRVWEGEGNLDLNGMRLRYDIPYNRYSSISFVLSIPYKLRSVGVCTDNPFTAAEELERILRVAVPDKGSKEAGILSGLAVLEHRRWVMEKVTGGAQRLVDKNGKPEYASCLARRSVKKKDDDGKLIMHPCIVGSTEDTPLITGKFADHAAWDDVKYLTSGLDELDRMSIELHRVMYQAANRIRRDHKELDDELRELKEICRSGGGYLKMNFDRYYFSIENILDKSVPYSSQFETYERMLAESLSESGLSAADDAKRRIQRIGDILFPVIESNMYRDYKDYDARLIRHIPFILTAKSDISICMPFGEASCKKSNNDDYFKSVASATALYAVKLKYLYVYDSETNIGVFRSKLKAVRNYFYYRGLNCDIELALFTCRELSDAKSCQAVDGVLTEAETEGWVNGHTRIDTADIDELKSAIVSYVKACGADYFDGTNTILRSNLENGRLMEQISQEVPYFEFDSYNRRFLNCVGCGYLEYTGISSFIQVEDMFALLNAKDKEFNYQDYSDCYRELWSIYCGDAIGVKNFALCARSWTRLAEILKTGGADQLKIVNEPFATRSRREIDVVTKMLKALNKMGFISGLSFSEDSKVSCRIKDKRTKGIFLKAGELLEIYVYFEACRTGWFDDVQTGYSFGWEFDDVKNELDCVLTKGYRSILVECKSTREPNESFYLTLDSLADHFGIGYKKVLIMVTDNSTENYEHFDSRGKQMDIITISGKNDLMRIGEKLKQIMQMP